MENSAKCKGKANLTKAKNYKFVPFVVLKQLGRIFEAQNTVTTKYLGYQHFQSLWDLSSPFSASYEFFLAKFLILGTPI